jgi:hypothetical protein
MERVGLHLLEGYGQATQNDNEEGMVHEMESEEKKKEEGEEEGEEEEEEEEGLGDDVHDFSAGQLENKHLRASST